MSRNYDNWERLMAAVIKRRQIWELCHQPSRTPSICSEASSSDYSSSCLDMKGKYEAAQKPAATKLVLLKGSFRGRFGRLRRSDQDFLAKGTQLVMKKLMGEVRVTEEEFKTVFGNCRHENVGAPRAYYFSNNGNFILNEYHRQGSVYDTLRRGTICVYIYGHHLGWGSRLKIAIGAARGIAHIHNKCGEKNNCMPEFGLADIMRMPGEMGGLDYHASEYEFKNVTSHDESDVRVVLLELVPGRSSMEPQGSQKNLHIVACVGSFHRNRRFEFNV